MREKGKSKLFWGMVSEDRDLVFFAIGFLAWVFDFVARVVGLATGSWLWVALQIAIPVFFALGIALYIRKHYRLTQQLTSQKHLPIVVTVGKPLDQAQEALVSAQQAITKLTGFRAFKQLEETFNVRYQHLMPHESRRLQPNPEQWRDFIEDAQRSIHRFSDALPGEKLYHVFIFGPASLALGLGVAFGTKHPAVVYQKVNDQYQPVVNLMEDVRRIKKIIKEEEYKYIQISYPRSLAADTAVVLDMASHTAVSDVSRYLKEKGTDMEIVHVSSTYAGDLAEDDWSRPVEELYSLFHELQSKGGAARYHLFHTMPVTMAFTLGMALGNFLPITVYNWETPEATYYPVLKLNEIESFV